MKNILGITMYYSNGDSGHSTDEEELLVDDQEILAPFVNDLALMVKSPTVENVADFYVKVFTEGTPLYNHLLERFCWLAHDKLGWFDVMISITKLSFNGQEIKLDMDEDALGEFIQNYALQLVRDPRSMYLYNP